LLDIGIVHVSDYWFNFYLAGYLSNVIRSGNSLGSSLLGITLREHRLTLQVRRLNKVAINNAQVADAGAGQTLSVGRTECATSHEQSARFK